MPLFSSKHSRQSRRKRETLVRMMTRCGGQTVWVTVAGRLIIGSWRRKLTSVRSAGRLADYRPLPRHWIAISVPSPRPGSLGWQCEGLEGLRGFDPLISSVCRASHRRRRWMSNEGVVYAPTADRRTRIDLCADLLHGDVSYWIS